MKIILAEHAGYCFGVNRAVDLTLKVLNTSSKNTEVYSLGPLIHNKQAVEYLNKLGLKQIDDIDKDLDENQKGKVIIRAHGVPYNIHKQVEDLGFEPIDTTCPFVKNIYKKAKKCQDEGYQVIIIGDPEHPEVIGINGWCDNKGKIVNTEEEAESLPKYEKICIVSQTTNTQEKFKTLSNIIKNKGKNIEIFNTICNATNLRQNACKDVAKQADAMIVIGGFHSSNTNKLAEVARKYCDNVYHIETIDDLPLQEMTKFNTIGITAGASTPDWIIKEVINTMDNANKNINDKEIMEAIEDTLVEIRRGDIVKGKIIAVTEDEVMVNINYKSDGIIYKEELSNDPSINPKELYKEGDEIEVYILKLDDGEGNVLLSTKRVEDIKSWELLEKIYKENEIIDCKVIEVVKGGVIALVKGLKGFIPASHISVEYVNDFSVYKGKTLEVKIIDLDKNKKRIILSRKVIEQAKLKKKQEKLWDSLEKGKKVEGEVKRLTDFGAFVDLGGVDGLIHISDLSWSRIDHPSDVISEGDIVEIIVLDFSKERNRISLGYKQTLPKPWDVFIERHNVGDIVEGTVVNLLDFGAFVRLKEGVDGLVHVSEIAHEHVDKPQDVLKRGEKVKVKIIDIDEKRKRISLSIKQIDSKEEKPKKEIENEEMNVTIGDMTKDD